MRLVLAITGTCFVALGLVGAIVPLLPTTPFLLLAAGCYAKSSRRLHERLVSIPFMGEIIRDWEDHRAITRRTRSTAAALIASSFTFSIVFALPDLRGQLVMALLGIVLITFIYRLPVRD